MIPLPDLKWFQDELRQHLTANILRFYLDNAVDKQYGGFYGRIGHDGQVYPESPKGLVQHSRMLWAFAHAYRKTGADPYRLMAQRAYYFLIDKLLDYQHGGFFWLVDYRGDLLEPEKYLYGQAFAIYGLSEYFLATNDQESLEKAASLFQLIESRAVDAVHGGYFDVFGRDWRHRLDQNIDQASGPVHKTMNTHLHMREAYTNLLSAWTDEIVRTVLSQVLQIHLDRILRPGSPHMSLHFNAQWESVNQHLSFGHDIEASWLLIEAADLLANPALKAHVSRQAVQMAQAVYDEGLSSLGGLAERPGDQKREWWPQAEAMVGFFNAYQLSRAPHFLEATLVVWEYVKGSLVDQQHGEWYWGRHAGGRIMDVDKAGLWKTPYHNSRTCWELIRRIDQLTGV